MTTLNMQFEEQQQRAQQWKKKLIEQFTNEKTVVYTIGCETIPRKARMNAAECMLIAHGYTVIGKPNEAQPTTGETLTAHYVEYDGKGAVVLAKSENEALDIAASHGVFGVFEFVDDVSNNEEFVCWGGHWFHYDDWYTYSRGILIGSK